MQPIIKDNFLPDYYLDTINEYIESSTFDWYLLNNISGKENKYNAEGVNFLNNQIGFYHNVYSQEAQSNLFMLTKPLLKLIGPAFDIDVEQVFRIRLGMFIPNGKEGSHYPHVDYDFEHKIVKSIDSTPGFSGFHGERIVIDHDSSADNPATLTGYAELRSSFKVGAITHLGIGSVYVQQVNPSSPA